MLSYKTELMYVLASSTVFWISLGFYTTSIPDYIILVLKLLTTFTTFFVLLTIRACIKSQFCKPVYLFIIRDHKLFGYKTELIYRKIPKMFWGWYFSKAFFEALIFGGAYMQRKFAFKNRLGWYWEGNVRLKIDWDSL